MLNSGVFKVHYLFIYLCIVNIPSFSQHPKVLIPEIRMKKCYSGTELLTVLCKIPTLCEIPTLCDGLYYI